MRWSIERPKEGNIRTIKKFAFFPTLLTESDYKVWLETYNCTEEYSKVLADYNGVVGWILAWVERKTWLS